MKSGGSGCKLAGLKLFGLGMEVRALTLYGLLHSAVAYFVLAQCQLLFEWLGSRCVSCQQCSQLSQHCDNLICGWSLLFATVVPLTVLSQMRLARRASLIRLVRRQPMQSPKTSARNHRHSLPSQARAQAKAVRSKAVPVTRQ